jgi:para-nitrobenzyl esterase
MTACRYAVTRPGPRCSAVPVLAACSAALLLAACGGGRARETPVAPTVEANHETLVGAYGDRYPRVASFKGIPFAAPPVGELRWRAPQPHTPRAGVQTAQGFAAACFQDSYLTDWYRRVGAAFGADPADFSDPPSSEDCLYLNVWTPALDRSAHLPVMVWIHGGSNKSGWSFEPNYHGEVLAARGHVVVVSIAYRVGIFGFFGHPELRGSTAPANFGLLDQVAALRWVHANIRPFGGDPGNVTVFGESTGATGIGYLMTSSLAGGLFRRAASQSGGSLMRSDASLADAEKAGLQLADALPGHPGLAELRRRPSAEVFQAAKVALPDHDFEPVVDGISLTLPPAAYYRRHGIPYDLLIGSNSDEWHMYVDDTPASLTDSLKDLPPATRELLI